MLSVLLILVGVRLSWRWDTLFYNFLMNEHLRNCWTLELLLKMLHRLFFSFCLLSDKFWIFRDSLYFSKFRLDINALIWKLINLLDSSLIILFWRKLYLISYIFASAGRKSYFFLLLSLEWLLISGWRINFWGLLLIKPCTPSRLTDLGLGVCIEAILLCVNPLNILRRNGNSATWLYKRLS